MDSWPCHGKKYASEGLAKRQDSTETLSYPLVTHGGPNLVSLVERDGRFQWTTLFKDEMPYRLHAGKTCVAFPPTCPPPLALPRLSLKQNAEQGANFIRTYHPDVDIPADLIREHLTEATRYTDELRSFNPYAGNVLESVVANDANDKKHTYLAFPMGELKSDLNLSPLLCPEGGQLIFKPSANPVKSFHTPILQIVSSRDSDSRDRNYPSGIDPYFAVRTHGSTTLFKLAPPEDSAPVLNDLATLSASDVGGNTIQDVKLNSELNMFVVNNRGMAFLAAYGQESAALHLIYDGSRGTQTVEHHDLWRVALGTSRYECTLMSGFKARLLDSRANSSLTLFSLDVLNDRFTSLEDEAPDGIIRFCTTEQIIWIDKRYPKRPLLGLKHSRNYDPTLRTETIQFERRQSHSSRFFVEEKLTQTKGPITFLTSKRNGLITVYDVSRLEKCHLSLHKPPYCLPLSKSQDKGNRSQLFFRHPYHNRDSSCTVFNMCDRGGIKCFDLSLSTRDGADTQVEWSEDVNVLHNKVGTLQEDIGALGIRDRTEFDLSSAYEHLFFRYEEQRERREDEEAERLYEVIEQAPLFWQKADTAEEQVLTAHDLLFRTGEEPQEISKANFLSESVINSVRGYRALNQGRLSSATLGKGAAWTCDIAPTLRHFVPEATQNIQELMEHLSQFDLLKEGDRSYRSIQREVRGREQLALDLVLASSIYSSHSVVGLKRVQENLESMAEALSLDSDAPPIQFGYLHPLKQDNNEGTEESNGDVKGTPGVCMLLKEWQVGAEVGADPKAYVRSGSFHEGDPTQLVVKAKTGTSLIVQPPTVAASRNPTLFRAGDTRHEVFSQDAGAVARAIADSQEVFASTQIVPGPYGGRSGLGKKKKRLGGF